MTAPHGSRGVPGRAPGLTTGDAGRVGRTTGQATARILTVLCVVVALCAPYIGIELSRSSTGSAARVRTFNHPLELATGAAASTGSLPQPLTPAMLLKAYRIDELHAQGLLGQGRTVIIPAIDKLDVSYLDAFDATNQLPAAKIVQFGTPSTQDLVEVNMDVQIVHAVAPQAKIVVVNMDGEAGRLGGWAQVINDYSQKYPSAVWTWSIGFCETDDTGESHSVADALQRSVAAGAVHFAASGDSGGYDCYSNSALNDPPRDEYRGGILPSTAPAVTSVGGTRLILDSSGRPQKEVTWYEPAVLLGAGGGPSRVFSGRTAPDVAADADPATGMIFVCGRDQSCAAGGTSASSPFWAGLGALLQQDLSTRKLGTLSPFNDRLAKVGASAKPGTFRHPQYGFNAVAVTGKGHDAVTGWGAPDAILLEAELRRVVAAR